MDSDKIAKQSGKKLKSLRMLEEYDFTEEEDEQIAMAISYLLWKREQKENK